MNADHDRDRMLDQALKQALGSGAGAPATAACLDAETLAAWTDGGLDARSVAMAEAHASSCARCQALLATIARTTPAVTTGTEGRAHLWRWWFAPLAAGAAAAALWMVVPSEQYSAPPAKEVAEVAPEPQPARERDTAAKLPAQPQAAPPSAGKDEAAAPTLADNAANRNRAADAGALGESKRKAEALSRSDKPVEGRERPEPRVLQETVTVAAPPLAQLRLQAAASEILSPDATYRWRIGAGGLIDYSTNGGRSWTPVATGIAEELTTGSSSSPTVCWVVGRAGVVLVTADARTFTRLPFPESVDLVSVQATDARSARVTTSDGRIFRTEDAGQSWRRQ